MKAKICDRCGKVYSKNNKIQTNGRISGSYIGGLAYITYEHKIDACTDLCDDCINDLLDFMIYDESKQK